MALSKRTFWLARDFNIADEPLALSLLKYHQAKNRKRVRFPGVGSSVVPNLISSITQDGKQLPIIDLDFAHHHVESSTDGHTHLYLDVPISKLRWTILMFALYQAHVIELGFLVWSLRRGGNFMRLPGVQKKGGAESTKPTYGWFFKLRRRRG